LTEEQSMRHTIEPREGDYVPPSAPLAQSGDI